MPLRTLQRGKDKPRLTTDQKRAARRVSELSKIYWHQYPHGLPHNGLGVKYAKYICRTMAFLPDDGRKKWLDQHAPWMDATTRDYVLSLGPYLVLAEVARAAPRTIRRGPRKAESVERWSNRRNREGKTDDQQGKEPQCSRAPPPQERCEATGTIGKARQAVDRGGHIPSHLLPPKELRDHLQRALSFY